MGVSKGCERANPPEAAALARKRGLTVRLRSREETDLLPGGPAPWAWSRSRMWSHSFLRSELSARTSIERCAVKKQKVCLEEEEDEEGEDEEEPGGMGEPSSFRSRIWNESSM